MRGSHPICMRGGWRAAADSVMHREIIMFVGVSVFSLLARACVWTGGREMHRDLQCIGRSVGRDTTPRTTGQTATRDPAHSPTRTLHAHTRGQIEIYHLKDETISRAKAGREVTCN